jgi:hypothetical protein
MIGAIFKVTLRKGQIVDTFLELICWQGVGIREVTPKVLAWGIWRMEPSLSSLGIAEN